MADVLAMLSSRLSEPNALEAEQYDKHHLVFKTTALSSGVAASQKNFWDCRCEDKFLDKFHESLEGWPGKRPCLYEYFLFYTHDVIQAVLATERDISLAFDFESQPRSSSILCGSHRNFIHSPTLLTEWERLGRGGAREVIRYMADVNQKHPTNVMDLIWDAFKRSMKVHYDSLWDNLPLYLDHYAGARGGPLDMLRLHRFISLDKLGMHERHVTNFFVWRAYERFRLGQWTPLIQDAEKHLADSLRYLFAPSATSVDKECRSACSSLAGIEWAKEDVVPEHLKETSRPCPSSVWVKAYPRGISFRGVRQKGACRGGNILEWRNKWDIVRQRDRQHCPKTEKLVVRRTWQCLGCCPELKDIICKTVSDRCQYYGLFDKSVSREEKWQDWMLYHGGIDASTDMNITGLSDMLDPDAHFVSRYNTRARTPAFEEDDRAILFHEAYKVKPVEWTGLGQTWE